MGCKRPSANPLQAYLVLYHLSFLSPRFHVGVTTLEVAGVVAAPSVLCILFPELLARGLKAGFLSRAHPHIRREVLAAVCTPCHERPPRLLSVHYGEGPLRNGKEKIASPVGRTKREGTARVVQNQKP